MRELQQTMYSSEHYSDDNMLMNFKLLDPVSISKNLTYLWGKDSNLFPLLTYTEGNGAIKSLPVEKLKDTQYTWDVMGRMKHISKVIGLVDSNLTKPGVNHTEFQVIFEDNWLIKDHGAVSPDGMFTARIQGEGVRTADNHYVYTFVSQHGDGDIYPLLENFETGKYWLQTAPSIASSKSDGNRSNKMAPGKLTNQFGYHRFSKNIAGNIANKITPIQFDLEGGGTTNAWMPFEMKLFEIDRRLETEDDLWNSEYNRDANGVIHLKDPRTGELIPKGAGVKQIVKSAGNYDTYFQLTLSKIDSIIDAIYNNRVDSTPDEIVIYTGKGGKKMWHNAILSDAVANKFFTPLGEKVISGGNYLEYGSYFSQYRTINDQIITIKESKYFDHGLRAEQDRANGRMYQGLPFHSYELVFIDHSKTDNGERNIQMVAEEGREIITGVYKGMSPVPGSWGSFNNILSTREDVASYEVITSQGINFKNPTTSFWLHFEGEAV